MRAVRAVAEALRRAGRALGRVPSVVLCLAVLATAVMYCSNDNLDAHPEAPRGDGVYRPVMARGDGHMHFLVTRSLVFDRDVNFDNDLKQFGDPWNQPRTKTGRKLVLQQIGPSLVWAPFLAVAHGAALVANLFGAHVPKHGYTLFHQRIMYASGVLFAWLALALGLLVAARLAVGRWALMLAGVGGLLGTSVLYYATYMPSYAHAMDAAAAAGFLGYWALTLETPTRRRAVILGALLGVAVLVRMQDIALGIVVAIEVIVRFARTREVKAPVIEGAIVLGVSLIGVLPQCYVWKQMFGVYFTTPQGPGYMRYGHPFLLETLFASRNGWFSTTPLAYGGVIGLIVGAIDRRTRLVCGALLAAVVVQVYLNACVYDWWGGAGFGQRRLCSMTLPIIVGLGVLLAACARVAARRVPVGVLRGIGLLVVGYLVAWNLAWTSKLRHGVAAGRDNRATCCTDVPGYLAWLAKPVYAAIGNPFELPASAVFGMRHGVPWKQWDLAVGAYPLVPEFLAFEDKRYLDTHAVWSLTSGGATPYVLEGMGAPRGSCAYLPHCRRTLASSATFILPLLVPARTHVSLPLASPFPQPVVVRWHGHVVARPTLGPTPTTVGFDTDGSTGSTVIELSSPLPGLEVGDLGLGFTR